jgi:hypothetical protein
MIVLQPHGRSSKEVPVSIIGGLDVHRRQITYDWVDTETGQQRQGRLAPASREHLRGWLEQFAGQQATFALEGCTGWRYVVEELQLAGITAHLAEPADTRALRGRKRHAKTDRADARHLRELLVGGGCPSRGSHRPTCWRPAPRSGCTRPWSTSGPPGSSASMRCCSTTACRPSPICWSPSAASA